MSIICGRNGGMVPWIYFSDDWSHSRFVFWKSPDDLFHRELEMIGFGMAFNVTRIFGIVTFLFINVLLEEETIGDTKGWLSARN